MSGRYGSDQVQQAVQGNFLKLNVFYKSMSYTNYTQVPSYDDFQFVSDLGKLQHVSFFIVVAMESGEINLAQYFESFVSRRNFKSKFCIFHIR